MNLPYLRLRLPNAVHLFGHGNLGPKYAKHADYMRLRWIYFRSLDSIMKRFIVKGLLSLNVEAVFHKFFFILKLSGHYLHRWISFNFMRDWIWKCNLHAALLIKSIQRENYVMIIRITNWDLFEYFSLNSDRVRLCRALRLKVVAELDSSLESEAI